MMMTKSWVSFHNPTNHTPVCTIWSSSCSPNVYLYYETLNSLSSRVKSSCSVSNSQTSLERAVLTTRCLQDNGCSGVLVFSLSRVVQTQSNPVRPFLQRRRQGRIVCRRRLAHSCLGQLLRCSHEYSFFPPPQQLDSLTPSCPYELRGKTTLFAIQVARI